MIRNIIFSILLFCAFDMLAQETDITITIKLIAPKKTRGLAVMKAFNNRQSVREFSSESISNQDRSDLLWAANGINRPDGRRTAPTARNLQEVEMYVILPDGAYRYEPQ